MDAIAAVQKLVADYLILKEANLRLAEEIEAMKLMNEIEADVNGTIVEILAENGKSVEYGDRLFKVKKKS